MHCEKSTPGKSTREINAGVPQQRHRWPAPMFPCRGVLACDLRGFEFQRVRREPTEPCASLVCVENQARVGKLYPLGHVVLVPSCTSPPAAFTQGRVMLPWVIQVQDHQEQGHFAVGEKA